MVKHVVHRKKALHEVKSVAVEVKPAVVVLADGPGIIQEIMGRIHRGFHLRHFRELTAGEKKDLGEALDVESGSEVTYKYPEKEATRERIRKELAE